jgi:hypothetical protein
MGDFTMGLAGLTPNRRLTTTLRRRSAFRDELDDRPPG